MAYQRFILKVCPATVATSATLPAGPAHTVASFARAKPSSATPAEQTVATVAGSNGESASGDQNQLAIDIAIALERTAARLVAAGCATPDARARARAIVAGHLRNSVAFYVPQAHSDKCQVCGEREEPGRPFLPVLSARPDRPHWLHAACHADHVRRLSLRIEAAICVAVPSGCTRGAGSDVAEPSPERALSDTQEVFGKTGGPLWAV
jgi:hypothetical protein